MVQFQAVFDSMGNMGCWGDAAYFKFDPKITVDTVLNIV
jgi:hypothetical protein